MQLTEQFENKIQLFVKEQMTQDQAHDMSHLLRVVKTAKQLCEDEKACNEVVIPAAYLHDCVSFPKNHPDRAQSSTLAAKKAIEFLTSIDYPSEFYEQISHAIITHSYSANIKPETVEAKIVQDADRLDALGAIGIARCLQVGCSLGLALYNDEDPFCEHREMDDRAYSIDHFYNKLFKLADTMNTDSATIEAQRRTEFMREYLRQLGAEV
ncbi:phosphohydrolase [Psychromonas marina]|uniref:Phosphohydrolase n=1 Tax=Psychromonas marina TaxID=88364 RepID=A0ABQ6E1Z5_9GAMM|nr:HD domain-containing protein [Psychromonas marina]GLS91462.1 phosphohydrolase [Psychromonas marina]